MQINNNRTWMNMKVCLLAKRRDQPGPRQTVMYGRGQMRKLHL